MKKFARLSVLVIAMAIIVPQVAVKAQAFKNGDMVGNFGFGFGWYGYGYGTTSLPAISLSVEKGIKDLENIGPLSIGGIVGFKHASYAWQTSYDWAWNDIILAARGAIHYDLFKEEKVRHLWWSRIGCKNCSPLLTIYIMLIRLCKST